MSMDDKKIMKMIDECNEVLLKNGASIGDVLIVVGYLQADAFVNMKGEKP